MSGHRSNAGEGTFRFGVLDLPAELLRAQQEDKLVVFAGAGISQPPPSDLPNFKGLVEDLAGRDLHEKETNRLDWTLGRLRSDGIDVHRRTAERIDAPDSQPNDRHSNLLALFRKPGEVRVVTTNFDLHFEAAAKKLWDEVPEVWCAPALPIGDDFRGIVHLHGALGGPAERLVLTDRDFSRAYLTEGWARRFLLRLFPRFTVLFVGYSHNDPLVDYLARGLPADAPGDRFALTDDPEREWTYLGVRPVLYDKSDDHREASEAIADWAIHARRGAMENQVRAQQILSGLAEHAEPRDLDFLRWCLDHETYWRFFTNGAKGEGWLAWLEDAGFVERMFTGGLPAAQTDRLGYWIGENVVADPKFASRAVRSVAKHPAPLSADLWHSLLAPLYHGRKSAKLSTSHVSKWITSLIDRCPENADPMRLAWLATDLDSEGDRDLLLLLFDFLAEPRLLARPHNLYHFPPIKVRTRGEANDLQRIVKAKFTATPSLGGDDLLALGERHLRRAEILEAASGTNWKALSRSRNSIHPNSEDEAAKHYHGIHALIDATRIALHWLVETAPDAGAAHALRWCSSDNALLARLGIDGLQQTKTLTADQKLKAGLEAGWLRRSDAWEEVRHLLLASYREAERPTREMVVREFKSIFLREGVEDPEEARAQAWRLHHFLTMLVEITEDPGCDVLETELANLEKRFPGIGETEAPEAVPEPTVDEILLLAPEDLIEHLKLLADPVDLDGWGADDPLPDLLTEATIRDFGWSVRLARFASIHQSEYEAVWRALCDGWEAAALSDEQWATLMTTLLESPPPRELHHRLADLLERKFKPDKSGEAEIEPPIAPTLPLARYLLEESSDDRDRLDWDGADWLGVAVNSTAGRLGLFVLAAMSRLRKAEGDDWLRAAEEPFSLATDLLHPDPGRSRLGIPVLCSQLAFFDHHDPAWTREHLLPCFDWSADRRTAAQAWQGFAFWGRLSQTIWPELSPLLAASFRNLDDLDRPQIKNQFVDKLAQALFFFEENRPADWLAEYLRAADDSWKTIWTGAVLELLATLSPEAREEAGETWLAAYFAWRNDLSAAPLADEEWGTMHHWALFLPKHFGQIRAVLEQRDVVAADVDAILASLSGKHPRMKIDREALLAQPEEVAKYLLHLLKGTADCPVLALGDLRELTRELKRRGAGQSLVRALANKYVDLTGLSTDD